LKVLEWSFIKNVVTIVIHDAILALEHLQQAHSKLIPYYKYAMPNDNPLNLLNVRM
jgi:hypothetical protein